MGISHSLSDEFCWGGEMLLVSPSLPASRRLGVEVQAGILRARGVQDGHARRHRHQVRLASSRAPTCRRECAARRRVPITTALLPRRAAHAFVQHALLGSPAWLRLPAEVRIQLDCCAASPWPVSSHVRPPPSSSC